MFSGEQTYLFDVTINGDTNLEVGERFFVNVNNVSGAAIQKGLGIATILTDDPPVVISEFRTRGPNGANDEFIEIYNSTDSPIDISGWKIKGSNSSGTVATRVTVNNNTTLPARGHLLATNSTSYSGSVSGDQTYTNGITNDGGIALTTPDDLVLDQAGMSVGSEFKEGTTLAPLSGDTNHSYERKPGGFQGSTQDTDDNN
ncbi:MAG: hypothetical protein DMF74_08435, partial [Acidobacteria bacterium]